jgi:hypothetical protein
MIWLLLFIVVAGYTVASHREIIMFLKIQLNKWKDKWKS